MPNKGMVFQFSQKLIDDIKLCYQEEHGISLSEQEAQQYLSSFADLYIAFAEADARRYAGRAGGRPATLAGSSDRGVSNTSGTL
jgi:hypothetical protein